MTPHVLGQVRPDALVTRTADEPERHLRTGRAVTPCHTSETTGPAPNDSRRAFRTIANDIEPAVQDAWGRAIGRRSRTPCGRLAARGMAAHAVHMAESTAMDWTDHDVSDPGITLLQALVYAIGALGLTTATVVLIRRRRNSREAAGS
jgi:hypothetical protein